MAETVSSKSARFLPGLAPHGVQTFAFKTNQSFPRHSHDQFGIGAMIEGAQSSWSCIGQVEAAPGDVIMVNPGEVHDGSPLGGAPRSWRMAYIEPKIIRAIMDCECEGRGDVIKPSVKDPHLFSLFSKLFILASASLKEECAIEEALALTMMHVFAHHCERPSVPFRNNPSIGKARAWLDQNITRAVSLTELADATDLSRFQLLRGFRAEIGLTPHAYQIQRKIDRARKFLTCGATPAEAAYQAGFADQSHLTRCFKSRLGVTPGQYRRSLH